MDSALERRDFLGLLGAALLGPAAAACGRESKDRPWIPSDALLARLPALMELASVPAVSVAVVEDGELAWERAIGVLDKRTSAPADARTVFEAASLSKPAVAFVALALHGEGRLDLDRPLADYVAPPDVAASPLARKVTARHALSHSSGFRNWRRRPDPDWAPTFEPGSGFLYSGEGFVWLSRALEQIESAGFVELMTKRLFAPAGLEASTFLWNPALEGRCAAPHGRRGEPGESGHARMARRLEAQLSLANKPVESRTYSDLERAARALDPSSEPMPVSLVPNAASSLLTTPSEYAHFITRLMDSPPEEGPRLRDEDRRALLSPQIAVNGPLAWGLGVGLETRAGARLFWHWGDNEGYKNFVLGDPAGRRGIVVFTNGDGGAKVYQRVIADAIGFEPASFVWV
jgi:CubicO group peptidase (beta-lactamase class C family)